MNKLTDTDLLHLGMLVALAFFIFAISKTNTPITPPLPAPGPNIPEPGQRVKWTSWPVQQARNGKSLFHGDILSHLPAKYGKQYDSPDPLTSGHETTHGINGHLRNTLCKPGEVAFYVGNGLAAVLEQPKITLAQVAAQIPKELRGTRYQLYFVKQQKDWNSVPLYIFDEWVAYTNEGTIALELTGQKEQGDSAVGQLEFAVYACCLCLAIERHDAAFFQNVQFKEYLANQLKRSTEQWRKAQAIPCYQWDGSLVLAETARTNGELARVLQVMYGDQKMTQRLFAKP